MKKIIQILLFFYITISPIFAIAQGIGVARWALQGIGSNDRDMKYVAGDAHAIIIVKDNDIYFSVMDNTLKHELGPAIKISNLYLSTQPDNNYFIIKGVGSMIGKYGNKACNITMKLSKEDGGNDTLFFNFHIDSLYLSGNLTDEEYYKMLFKLSALGTAIEAGGPIRGTLESVLRRDFPDN